MNVFTCKRFTVSHNIHTFLLMKFPVFLIQFVILQQLPIILYQSSYSMFIGIGFNSFFFQYCNQVILPNEILFVRLQSKMTISYIYSTSWKLLQHITYHFPKCSLLHILCHVKYNSIGCLDQQRDGTLTQYLDPQNSVGRRSWLIVGSAKPRTFPHESRL